MVEKRTTVKQIRTELRTMLRDAGLDYNQMSNSTAMVVRLRNTERIKVLEKLGDFVGGVSRLFYKQCALGGCSSTFVTGLSSRKYCTNACKAKAYRRRKRL